MIQCTMKITLVVVVAVLCLALAPCVPARPLQPSFGLDSSNLVSTIRQDGITSTPLGKLQDFLNPSGPGEERRLLKSKGSKPKKSKSKKSGSKKKSKKSKGGKATLVGSVVGVSIFLILVLLLCVVFFVTEKRKEDPKWRVRTLFRRRLKRKYTKKKTDSKGDMEKTPVEKELLEGSLDLDTDPVKKVEPADVK